MEIKLIKTIEETLSVELPIFWKKRSEIRNEYLGVIDQNNVISLIDSKTYKSVITSELWLKGNEVKEAYSNWDRISETEFLDAHEAFIQSLSLTPKII